MITTLAMVTTLRRRWPIGGGTASRGESGSRPQFGPWTRHRGGEPPLKARASVAYQTRDGFKSTGRVCELNWTHHGYSDDIVSYCEIFK